MGSFLNKIIQVINPKKTDHIIEIGPGRGSITEPISKLIAEMTAIEIAKRFGISIAIT